MPTETVKVTFDRFAPSNVAGKTVEAVKVVKEYTETIVGDYGHKRVNTWTDTQYLIDGQYWGAEFFVN